MYQTSQKQIVMLINLVKKADLVEMRHNMLLIQFPFAKVHEYAIYSESNVPSFFRNNGIFETSEFALYSVC